MITRSQLEFILDDTVMYCGLLIVICTVSFGLGLILGAIWLL
jgi:hypothetical protein